MAMKLWRESSSRFKRFLTIFFFLVFSIIVSIAGVLTPLSADEANNRSDELKKVQEQIKTLSFWEISWYIFQNNFLICLMMFIPFIGPFIGSYVLYNTGVFIGATAQIAQVPGILVFVSLFIFPFAWLEYIAYATGFSGSMWLSWRIVRRRGFWELVRTVKLIAISAALLFAGALIEALLILNTA